MAEEFRVEARRVAADGGEVCVFSVTGVVDSRVTDEFGETVMAEIREGVPNVVFDLSGVGYISSAGLRLFLKIRRAALDAGGCVRVAGLHRDIRENVFDALGFSRLIELHPSVDEAVRSIGPGKG